MINTVVLVARPTVEDSNGSGRTHSRLGKSWGERKWAEQGKECAAVRDSLREPSFKSRRSRPEAPAKQATWSSSISPDEEPRRQRNCEAIPWRWASLGACSGVTLEETLIRRACFSTTETCSDPWLRRTEWEPSIQAASARSSGPTPKLPAKPANRQSMAAKRRQRVNARWCRPWLFDRRPNHLAMGAAPNPICRPRPQHFGARWNRRTA